MSANPSQWWGQQTTTWPNTPTSSPSPPTPQDINIPAEVLSHAQIVSSVPSITNLRADQRVAEVEVPKQDGSTDRIILVMQQQKSATQSRGPHPGSASFYDDCVSDYSHEQPRQSTQHSQTLPQRRTSADYGRMPEILAANAARAQATAAQSVFSAPLGSSFVFMPSGVGARVGELFKVLQIYSVKAATEGKAIGSQTRAGLVQGARKLRPVAAHLISLGKELISDIDKARSAAQASRSRGLQRSSQSREVHIRMIETEQQINPTIPLLPRDVVLVNDVRRRAAQTLPALPSQQKVSRKPAPLPRHGPLGKIKLPQSQEQQSSSESRDPLGRKKVARPMAVWEEIGYQPPPRACRPTENKPVINPAYQVRSQHASLASESVANSRASQTSRPSQAD